MLRRDPIALRPTTAGRAGLHPVILETTDCKAFPTLAGFQFMRPTPGNDLIFGKLPGRPKSLGLSRTERDKHLYVCGGTGTGKSKFLESLIRQDILNWSKSKCGLLVIDPHGNLYDNLINWLAWSKFERPIIPIDLRQDDWVVSYNLLRQRKFVDPAVLVDNLIDAMAYVWGQGGMGKMGSRLNI